MTQNQDTRTAQVAGIMALVDEIQGRLLAYAESERIGAYLTLYQSGVDLLAALRQIPPIPECLPAPEDTGQPTAARCTACGGLAYLVAAQAVRVRHAPTCPQHSPPTTVDTTVPTGKLSDRRNLFSALTMGDKWTPERATRTLDGFAAGVVLQIVTGRK